MSYSSSDTSPKPSPRALWEEGLAVAAVGAVGGVAAVEVVVVAVVVGAGGCSMLKEDKHSTPYLNRCSAPPKGWHVQRRLCS